MWVINAARDVAVSTNKVRFDEKRPVDVEERELLCIGNAGEKRLKVQLLATGRWNLSEWNLGEWNLGEWKNSESIFADFHKLLRENRLNYPQF